MDKIDYIDAYFRKWVDDIERAGRLLENDEYALEGYLVLVCYLGALAELRFPDMNDNEKYRRFHNSLLNLFEIEEHLKPVSNLGLCLRITIFLVRIHTKLQYSVT